MLMPMDSDRLQTERVENAVLPMAEVALETGQLETAKRLYQRLLDVDPKSVRARMGLGEIAFRRGDSTEAARWHLAAAANAQQPEQRHAALLAHGRAALESGQLEAARDSFAQLADPKEQAPSASVAWGLNGVGLTLLLQGDLRGAVTNMEQAVRRAPSEPVFRENLERALALLGETDREAPPDEPEAVAPAAPADEPEAATPTAPADAPEAVAPTAPTEESEAAASAAPTDEPEADEPAAPAEEPEAVAPAAPADEPESAAPSAPADEPEAVAAAAPAEEPEAAAPVAPADEPEAAAPVAPADEPEADVPAAPAEELEAVAPAAPADEPEPDAPATPADEPEAVAPTTPADEPQAAGPTTPADSPTPDRSVASDATDEDKAEEFGGFVVHEDGLQFVQMGAYKHHSTALTLASLLRDATDQTVRVVELPELYRVRIGPIDSREALMALVDDLWQAGYGAVRLPSSAKDPSGAAPAEQGAAEADAAPLQFIFEQGSPAFVVQENGSRFLQFGAYRDRDAAATSATRLQDLTGERVHVSEAEIDGATLHRVRAGPIESEEALRGLVEAAESIGFAVD